MARKSKEINEELKKVQEKLEEVEKLKQEAEAEEKALFEIAETEIKTIADKNDMFCGVILNRDDIVAVVDIALKTGESVKIPFKLYYKS